MTTIHLKYPITSNGIEIKSVTLRRITVGDLEVVSPESSELGKSLKLVSMLGELSPEDVRKIDASDFNKFNEAVSDFLA